MTTPTAPFKYGDNGDLYIWTGTGYQIIPKFAQGDISLNPASEGQRASSGDSEYWVTQPSAANVSLTDSAAGKYGNVELGNPNNWATSWDPSNPDSWNLKLKSGDKEGTNIQYVLKNGYWTPQVTGSEYWNTNRTLMDNIGPFIPIAAALGAAYLPGLLGGGGAAAAEVPGTMTTYGVLDTSMALPGTTFTSGVGAAGGAAADLASAYGPSSALDGSAGNISGFAGSGQSGVTAFGQPFSAGATLSGAGEAAGSLGGLPNMLGVPGATMGGAFAGSAQDLLSPSLGGGANNYLAPPGSTTPPTTTLDKIIKEIGVGNLIKGGMTLAGGLRGANSANGNNAAGSGGPGAAIPPSTIPQMYGGQGGTGVPRGLLDSWGPQGNTQTEAMMRRYMTNLLGI